MENWKKNEIVSVESSLPQKWIKYSEQDETVLYVGSLIKNKGVGELLIIAPKLITIKPNLKFVFCGSGPYKQHMVHMLNAFEEGNFEKAKMIASAGEFVTELKIEDHFLKIDRRVRDRIIFTGLLESKTISDLIPLCTVIVNPSRNSESFCMRTIESLCVGVTPIANNHSWFAELLNCIETSYPELGEVIKVDRQ
ncbi:MAG: glycosyltransferase [Ignavibacteria bacterium]|nr:glycosyltransferase [Ignavibacteria bacterium]